MTSSPKGTGAMSDAPVGRLVQYEDDSQVLLGVVLGLKRDKFAVLNMRGREIELPPQRAHLLPGSIPSSCSTQHARVEFLESFYRKIDEQVQNFSLEDVWSFVWEDEREYSAQELTELYYSDNSLEHHLIVRTALLRHKSFFKRNKDFFIPRSQETVESLRRQEAAKVEKERIQGEILSFLETRIKDRSLPIPSAFQNSISLLVDTAAQVEDIDPARLKEAKEFLASCCERLNIPETGTLESRAYAVLEEIGVFEERTNLALLRYKIPQGFSPAVEEICEHLEPWDKNVSREDMTKLHTFTIDDATTRDMDDALSLERSLDGHELGIHISDVSAWVAPDSLLDRDARRRTTSVYLADRVINMLPPKLSEDRLSLIEGRERKCVSWLVTFDRNFRVTGTRIVPTTISVKRRYTYEEVDELLEREADEALITLSHISSSLETERLEAGATNVAKRQALPQADADGKVRLLEIAEDSPARLLVSELMVLANRLLGEYAREHRLPMIFRGQERPDEPEASDKETPPEGPAKDFASRAKFKKSMHSLEPAGHAGLGLGVYLQATSPIRRYIDLCHQRQVIEFQRSGKPWLDRDALEPMIPELEEYLQTAALASRETNRFWLLRYLEQRGRRVPIEGTVVRTDRYPLIELDEVYIAVPLANSGPVKQGQRLKVRFVTLDARWNVVKVERAE